MSRSIELSDEACTRLEQAAAAESVTPSEWIVEHVRACDEVQAVQASSNEKPAKSLAERFAGRVGVIGSGGKERLSERHSEVFGEMLDEKTNADRAGDPGTSHVLEIPDPVYAAIEEAAGAGGLTPLTWIAAQLPLSGVSALSNGPQPGTMAERLAGRIGRISSGSGLPSSDNVAKSFAEYLEEKQRAGHL